MLYDKTSMMRKLLIFLLLGGIWITGCEKLSEFTRFNLVYNDTVVIPSSAGINLPLNVFTPDIESNAESEFSVNDTRKDLIEEITLTDLNLSVNSPESGDFRFLESIEIYLGAEGLDEIRIAWQDSVPPDVGKYLELETSGEDLQAYIKKDEFSLRVHTVTDELIESDHEIKINSVFYVDARILGQ